MRITTHVKKIEPASHRFYFYFKIMEIYSESLLQLYRDRESTRQGAMSVDGFGEACLLPPGKLFEL